jgi:hypothetical protein
MPASPLSRGLFELKDVNRHRRPYWLARNPNECLMPRSRPYSQNIQMRLSMLSGSLGPTGRLGGLKLSQSPFPDASLDASVVSGERYRACGFCADFTYIG